MDLFLAKSAADNFSRVSCISLSPSKEPAFVSTSQRAEVLNVRSREPDTQGWVSLLIILEITEKLRSTERSHFSWAVKSCPQLMFRFNTQSAFLADGPSGRGRRK